MDKLNQKILSLLKDDARMPVKTIAKIAGVETAVVEKSMSKMEEEGIIVKYQAIINEDLLDEEIVESLIELRVTPEISKGFDAIADDLLKFPEVDSLYLMSGGYDLCVVVKGKSLKQVANFVAEELSTLENVIGTKTHFILRKYKKDGVVVLSDNIKKRDNITL